MERHVVSTCKLALLLALVCALILASSDSANATAYPLLPIQGTNLTISDPHELGQVLPGIPAGNSDREQYVNFMIGLSLGGSGHVIINGKDNLVTRSKNDFGPLPGPAAFALTGMGMTINLGTQGTYDYLLAKYDGPNGGSEVWYIADLNGMITIPATWGKYGLSGWALFTAPASVPEGGATLTLLGSALAALGVMRRWLLTKR